MFRYVWMISTINGHFSGQTIDGAKYGRQSWLRCFQCDIMFKDNVMMKRHKRHDISVHEAFIKRS